MTCYNCNTLILISNQIGLLRCPTGECGQKGMGRGGRGALKGFWLSKGRGLVGGDGAEGIDEPLKEGGINSDLLLLLLLLLLGHGGQ
jgi:hypothetical protein